MVEYTSNQDWTESIELRKRAVQTKKESAWCIGKRVCTLVILVLACVWMGVIYYFSDQEGQLSTQLSNKTLVETGIVSAETLDGAYYSDEMKALRRTIRKIAHLSLFGVLGALIAGTSRYGLSWSWRKATHVAFGVVLFYACLDEYHQSFVPGRAMSLDDVFIDLMGAAIGIGLLKGLTLVVKKVRRVKRLKTE